MRGEADPVTTVASLMPNATFFVEVALFAAVLGFITRFVVPPIHQAMRRRQEEIDTARSAASADSAEAREILAAARAEADGILDEARREGHRVRVVAREVADGLVAEASRRRAEMLAEVRSQEERLAGVAGAREEVVVR
jgi:F-type H+-transporting ATPase subunit b